MPEPMPHSLREKLLAVRTALSEYQAGNRNALFDSRARLRELRCILYPYSRGRR